jgi:Prealbumin-like fold domain
MQLPIRSRALRRRLGLAIAITATLTFALMSPGFANLAGSTFEGNDGNLVVDTAGNTDWANAPNRVVGIDQPSGGSDNSFGQGTKEDDPNTKVVTGSIPPNKNDLTRFYIGSEFTNNSNFLYLAWERLVNIGSANMDLEINQKPTPGFTGTTTGPVSLVRTAGDLLVTYDFSGSGTPTLGLLKWVTSGATSQCFSSNTLPCWGNRVNLSAAGFAEGAVNTATVTDPVPPDAPRTLTTGLFGEAAINLTAAGVFPPGTCEAFGSTFLKSRSSSSFPAEVKDFIAPQPINISNCGTVNIIKHTDPRGINQNFGFSSTIPDPPAGQTPPTTPDCSLDTTPSSFTLNDSAGVDPPSPIMTGTANTEHCANVPAGSYTVTESTPLPANFVLESLTCTTENGGSGSQDATNPFQANITVVPGSTVTCVYVDKQQLGAIKITKTSIKGNAPLAGAVFAISSGGTPIPGSPFTTGSDGTICVDHLAFGDYSVQETAAPGGYAIDDPAARTVTVDNNATCGDVPYVGETTSFTDTPLTDLLVKATAQAPGATQSSISCVDSNNADIGNSPQGPTDPVQVNANGLKPGTYTCTVVIDP